MEIGEPSSDIAETMLILSTSGMSSAVAKNLFLPMFKLGITKRFSSFMTDHLSVFQQHGYKGGLELTATIDYLFGYDATVKVVDDCMYVQVASNYAFDPAIQQSLQKVNPWAQNAIAEHLLEAAKRGMWSEPQQQRLENLHELYLQSETLLRRTRQNTAQFINNRNLIKCAC